MLIEATPKNNHNVVEYTPINNHLQEYMFDECFYRERIQEIMRDDLLSKASVARALGMSPMTLDKFLTASKSPLSLISKRKIRDFVDQNKETHGRK